MKQLLRTTLNHFSEDEKLHDNNDENKNGNSKSDYNNMENSGKQVQNIMKDMPKVVPQNAMALGQNGKLYSRFNLQHVEKTAYWWLYLNKLDMKLNLSGMLMTSLRETAS